MGTFAETANACRPRKANFHFPFAGNKRKFAVSVFFTLFAANKGMLPFLVPFSVYIYISVGMYILKRQHIDV
jgi:hypothetical protein